MATKTYYFLQALACAMVSHITIPNSHAKMMAAMMTMAQGDMRCGDLLNALDAQITPGAVVCEFQNDSVS